MKAWNRDLADLDDKLTWDSIWNNITGALKIQNVYDKTPNVYRPIDLYGFSDAPVTPVTIM